MKKLSLFTSALVLSSQLAFAGGDFVEVVEPVIVIPVIEEDPSFFYAGLSLTNTQTFSTDSSLFSEAVSEDKTVNLVGQVGYNYNEYLAFEARIGTSVFDEDYSEVLTYSIFVKPQYPVSEDFTVYGLLGFGQVNVDGKKGDNGEFSAAPSVRGQEILSESSFQWGLGLAYDINEDFSTFIDFTMLANDEDISSRLYAYDVNVYDKLTVQNVTLGVNYKF